MRFLCFYLLNIFYLSTLAYSQNLQFYREDLTFEIKDSFFYVDGIYHFCNNGENEIQQILFYPFPKDSLYGAVDSINAFDVNAKTLNIITNITEKGFYFKIKLQSYGIGKYKISYRQKLLKNKAEYILVTTRKWGKPLESAQFKLITPVDLKIISTTYNPDSTKQINNKMFYYWNKKDFMPNKNMVFNFGSW